jgi:hypothetical protein
VLIIVIVAHQEALDRSHGIAETFSFPFAKPALTIINHYTSFTENVLLYGSKKNLPAFFRGNPHPQGI